MVTETRAPGNLVSNLSVKRILREARRSGRKQHRYEGTKPFWRSQTVGKYHYWQPARYVITEHSRRLQLGTVTWHELKDSSL